MTHRLENVPFPYRRADADAWLARPHDPDVTPMMVLAHDMADGSAAGPAIVGPTIIGVVSLIRRDGDLMLGYWYTPAAWGRGYATEAGRAAIDIARHRLGERRLVSRHHADNPASGNVLRKLGFRETGARLTVWSVARGHAVDAIVMEMDLRERLAVRVSA